MKGESVWGVVVVDVVVVWLLLWVWLLCGCCGVVVVDKVVVWLLWGCCCG